MYNDTLFAWIRQSGEQEIKYAKKALVTAGQTWVRKLKEVLDEVQHGCDKSSNSCLRPRSYHVFRDAKYFEKLE